MQTRKYLLITSYFCNPKLKSEAYSGYKWFSILLKQYHILLYTTLRNKKDIIDYYGDEFPENVEIVGIKDIFPLRSFFHKRQLYLGYFLFIYRAYYHFKGKGKRDEVQAIFHRNPASFRYYTPFHKFNIPFIIGPVSGGLKPPPLLKDYFKKERLSNKFRKFDNLLLKFPVFKKQYQKADRILLTSEYVKDIIPLIPEEKTKIIRAIGVDIYTEPINRNKEPNEKKNILYVGNLVRYKGTELMIRSLQFIEYDNYVLDIVGEGYEMGYLKDLCSKINVGDKVRFHGKLDFSKVKILYQNADIFCFPTLKEAAGNVLLEAMMYSLPIITVNYGGPKYLCPEQGSYKIQISKIDEMVKELALKLDLLLSRNDLRTDMGRYNYDYCIQNYGWPKLECTILKIFAQYF